MTILVSHSVKQIEALCNKVLWLNHGEAVAFGETQGICELYTAFLAGDGNALKEASERYSAPGVNPDTEAAV